MAEGTASTHLGMSSLNHDRDSVPNVSRDSLLGHVPASGSDPTKQEGSETPATLRRSAFHEWLSTIFDVLFATIPLFFLVIAALCLRLDKQPTSQYGENVKAITLLSPTIFPIIYAAILGKVLRRIALYKAERSSTIGTLEQLVGSQSFVSSIERQFVMRRINIVGLLIIIAWLLSPLGGQSSLRLLTIQPYQEVVNTTIKHHSVAGFANDTLFSEHMQEYFWSSYAPIYMTALHTGRQIGQGPRDLFENVRIPDLRSLNLGEDPSQHIDRWYSVQNRPELSYTSLHGQPIIDLPKTGNVSFSLESSYWETNCDTFIPGANWLSENSTDEDPYRGRLSPGPSIPTFALLLQQGSFDEATPSDNVGQFQFNYVSKVSASRNINSSCTASFRTVESEVFCEDARCLVQKMRYLNRNVTSMFQPMSTGDPSSNWNWFVYLLTESMPGADVGLQGNNSRRSELVEQWMMDPNNMWGTTKDSDALFEYVNLSTLAPEVFSGRLQIAMNTFWDSTMNSSLRIGNLTSQDIQKNNETLIWTPINAIGEQWAGQRYVCNMVFAILTFVISGLLFIAAVVSVALGVMTRAPDVLGYVSTLARDDPYFDKHVPSHLDGLDASRRLRDERVILGDVKKNGNVGHVAFASMGMDPARISRKRLYD